MQRINIEERVDWKKNAEEEGFVYHTMYGEEYWAEGTMYALDYDKVEHEIEDVSVELHQMCLEVIPDIIESQEIMEKFAIPENMRNMVKESWESDERSLYGRFDLVWDGTNKPAKLLEYNADTPTSLYESSVFQWNWFSEVIEQNLIPKVFKTEKLTQFNSIHEKLVESFNKIQQGDDMTIYFSAFEDSIEDYSTVEYMGFASLEAKNIKPMFVDVRDISIGTNNYLCAKDGSTIENIFMLYPWEDMFRDDDAKYLTNIRTKFFEPQWKALLSNKAILPLLWNKFKGHPNLLESYFEEDENYETMEGSWVKKPIFSREGSSITFLEEGKVVLESENNDYSDNNMILQQKADLPTFDNYHPIIGSWMVGDESAGIGIREDRSEITQDMSRFVPHIIY